MRNFLEKADSAKCPTDALVELTSSNDNGIIKKHEFGALPDTAAKDWHCKWKISAGSGLLSAAIDGTTKTQREANGWIKLEVVSVGFDKDVLVFMQPPEALYDFNFRVPTNNPAKATYVGRSYTDRKYVFPAEYDIFIDVSPWTYNTGSDESPTDNGYVEFRATHLTTNPTPADTADDFSNWSEVVRLDALAGTEIVPTGPAEDAKDIDLVAPVDDSGLSDTKKCLDGNVCSQGERWGTQTAFSIGDTEITKEQVAGASGVVIALIVIIVVICCFFSYIERKKIAEEGRRLSTAVRRASTKLRRGSSASTEKPEKEMTDKDIDKAAGKAAGSQKEKNFLKDQMTH